MGTEVTIAFLGLYDLVPSYLTEFLKIPLLLSKVNNLFTGFSCLSIQSQRPCWFSPLFQHFSCLHESVHCAYLTSSTHNYLLFLTFIQIMISNLTKCSVSFKFNAIENYYDLWLSN